MNYKEEYRKLILTAKNENREKFNGVYYEQHHIIPEFMFNTRKRQGPAGHLLGDSSETHNLVLLTFKEHLYAHFYLYKILENTRYKYSAGSALAFFFTKATNIAHPRWKNLSEFDYALIDKMSYLREIGIASISEARKGKMPVVDAITRESIGSVAVNHPNVLSGVWVHHSKGKPGTKHPPGWGKGASNKNYREMTTERRNRILALVPKSIEDDIYFKPVKFKELLKKEFSEFNKVSEVWIKNNFESYQKLIEEYNVTHCTKFVVDRYHRSTSFKEKLRKSSKKYCWVTNGTKNKRMNITDCESFLNTNKDYHQGRTI